MPLNRVHFLNSGYCTQSSYLAGRRSWEWSRFHAVFVYLEHPRHGPALIDTGYSTHFRRATEPFPERFYRWLTPMHLDRRLTPPAVLAARGLRPEEVHTLFVSHFHGDHIAGLRDLPGAQFVYRGSALRSLLAQNRRDQVRHGFLATLVPDDFTHRGKDVPESAFEAGSGGLSELRVHDYWEDGSLLLVDLPGHAEGHTGYILQTDKETIFYVVDATWDMQVLLAGTPLPWLSRGFQFDYPAYLDTQRRLRNLATTGEYHLVACHCPLTQSLILDES